MVISKKSWLLFILVSVSVATILVAASLSSLELRPGRGRPVAMERQEPETGAINSPNPFMRIFIRIILFIAGILIPVSIIYHLRSSQGRRRMLILFIIVLSFFLLMNHLPWSKFQLRLPKLDLLGSPLGDNSQLPPQADIATPNPPWWLVLLVSLGLSALILGVSLYLWRRFRRRSSPLELVAKEARKTIDELRSGADLKEGVIRCYFEMNKVLREQRGLKRQQAMTTREFENYLNEIGLPDLHIRRLTRLFEKVRYGAKNLTSVEDREAIACLSAIARACEGSL
jgi:magnesium-transporting ATPase (P-type)